MSRMSLIINRLTGAVARHNRALGEVNEWVAKVGRFLDTYGLMKKNAALDSLLKQSGDAKFDLTGIAYIGRGMESKAKDIRDREVEPLVAKTVESVEVLRRCLIIPALRDEKLPQAAEDLRASYKKLHGALKKILYL